MDAASHKLLLVPDIVSGIVLLVLVASLTAVLGTRLPRLPFTIALVIVGALIAVLADALPPLAPLAEISLTPELMLFVFLPTLVFEAAYNLQARELQYDLLPVLTLAVPGLLLSTAVIGLIFYGFTAIPLIICLLLGAILSATDPVAVIALFRQLGVPERLTVLVEGESLFNDATSLVLATLLISIATSGVFTASTLWQGLGTFLWVFTGGIFVGASLALIVAQLLGSIDAPPPVEISLTTVLAYAAFILAEHSLHVSGIMAVVTAGLVMGNYGRSKVSPNTEHYLRDFWSYAAWLANALIFLLMGMQFEAIAYQGALHLIALAAIAMLASRALVVFGLVPQLARLPDAEPVSRAYQAVMFWGGLRGAVALAIVLSLPEFELRETLVTVVMGAVLFTLLVQGLSVEALVRKLGLQVPELADRLAAGEASLHAKQHSLANLERLEQGEFFSRRVADRLRSEAEAAVGAQRQSIKQLQSRMTPEEARRILSVRALSREKTRYEELFQRGFIGDWAYRELSNNVDRQLDDARHFGRLPGRRFRHSPIHIAVSRFTQALADLPAPRAWLKRRHTRQIMRDYDVRWARYRAASSVLEELAGIAEENGISGKAVAEVRDSYQTLHNTLHEALTQLGDRYPELKEAAQASLGNRLLLAGEQAAVDRSGALGIIPEAVAESIHADYERQLRALRQGKLAPHLEIAASDLITRVPRFAGLQQEQRKRILPQLRKHRFLEGDTLIPQAESESSLYLIACGRVSVVDERGKELHTLYAGDCFGEASLLDATPCNIRVRAISPGYLYELQRGDWLALCNRHPELLAAVKAAATERGAHRD